MRTAISILLALVGVLLIFAPVGSYYLGTYTHSKFKGTIQYGSKFEYYGIIGPFWDNSSHREFMMGISLNITDQSSYEYSIGYAIYRLVGRGQLNIKRTPHFIAQKITLEGEGNITVNKSNPLLEQLLPEKLLSITNTTHTFPDHFYGYPTVYLKGQDYYIKYLNGYVALGVSLDNPCLFMKTIYPKSEEYCVTLLREYGNETRIGDYLVSEVDLAGGNTVPPQDWRGWVRYGFGWSFPINVIFILLSLIMYILKSREG